MPDMKELREEMGKTFEAFKKANDDAMADAEKRSGTVSAEHQEKVDKVNEAITGIQTQMKEFEKRMARPGHGTAGGENVVTPEMELRNSAYEKYIRYGMGDGAVVEMSADERRALAGTADDDGQFLVPESFESNIIMKAFNNAELRPICQVGTTSRDAVKMGSLSKPLVAWGTRGLVVSEQTLNTGGILIPIKNVRALALISNDTLDDASADIMGELEDAFEMAVAEAEDDAFAVGTDADSPKGILASALVQANYTATGIAAAIADGSNNGIDVLKEMLYGLKKAYRRNATWAMNSTTEGVYRQLKDGNGQYLWDPSIDKDGVARLLGRPLVNPEGMPDIAANAYPVLLGDFKAGYKIRDRSGLVIKRLVERYAEYDQTGFLLKKRVGGGVALPEAFACLKVATN